MNGNGRYYLGGLCIVIVGHFLLFHQFIDISGSTQHK